MADESDGVSDPLKILEIDEVLDELRVILGDEELMISSEGEGIEKLEEKKVELQEERTKLISEIKELVRAGKSEEASGLTELASKISEEINKLDEIKKRAQELPKRGEISIDAKRTKIEEERVGLLKEIKVLVSEGKSDEASDLIGKASALSEELKALNEIEMLERFETILPQKSVEEAKGGLFGGARKEPIDFDIYDIGKYGPLASFSGIGGFKELERYSVDGPFAFISILYDEENREYLYHVVEPALTPFERTLLEKVYEDLRDIIIMENITMDSEKRLVLREKVGELLRSYNLLLDPSTVHKILYYSDRNYVGYGKINPLMKDSLIEDISCDGVGVPIFLYHRKYQGIKTNIIYEEKELDTFTTALSQRSGKHISAGTPMVNATLPDGSRLQATLGREITTRGSSFTIRKFREDPFTPVDLVDSNTYSIEMLAYLWLCIENNRSLIFSGGTATGKTSSLNAVSLFIPPSSKIVSVEDTRELTLYHQNWIASVTRESIGSNEQGSIDMYELLRQALRQRPECILVGEVRGGEALTLFQAMSTGHTTYSTMHAGSIQEAVSRLENEPMNVPSMMLQALDLISIQELTYNKGERVRRNKSIVEITGIDPRTGNIRINEVFKWNPVTDEFEKVGDSQIMLEIMRNRGWSAIELEEEIKRRVKILEYMVRHDMRDYREIARIVQKYFVDPERVIEEIEIEIQVLAS